MSEDADKARAAVENLLFQCAGGAPGQSLLIVHENKGDGFYGEDLHTVIADQAKKLGFLVEFYAVAFDPEAKAIPDDLAKASKLADHTVFVARLADQIRFQANTKNASGIITYAIDRDMLTSDFGVNDYKGFEALKTLVNILMMQADCIHVTCKNGSNFSGHAKNFETGTSDVTVKRFPMSIFAPLPTENFAGTIAQNGFLVGTGSKYYKPYACALRDTLLIEFSGNKITGFQGDAADVTAAKNHYRFVANKYGIDPFYIHSWHAGIHPSCSFNAPASASFERWSGAAFGNPRLLHFHSCGKYPPGEICLNIVDPTVSVDGEIIWDGGVFHPERLPSGRELLAEYPSLASAFENPANNIGLGKDGRLSFV